MARKARREATATATASSIKLQQPDRTAPTEKTLLDFAGERSLFAQASARQRQLDKERGVPPRAEDGGDDSDANGGAAIAPLAERILDTLLWCASLATLHLTLDVLVQNQYAVAIEWPVVVKRSIQALGGMCSVRPGAATAAI